jgi:hypothetical protein
MSPTRSLTRLTARFAVPGEPPRPLQLSCHALLDGCSVTRRLERGLPAVAADLIEIAAAIYAIDRLVRRPGGQETARSGNTWARDLWVQMPVREPQLWSVHSNRLTDLLAWLTDDSWSLEFIQLAEGTGPLDEPQGSLFDTVPDRLAPVLFSGGLDSAAGLASHLADGDAVAVSVDTNNWMQHVQQRVLRDLQTASGNSCVPLRYRVSVGASSIESSQRSRGLLFLGVGIATSWALHQNRLRVFENGIGAINLPYLRAQHGSQATKSMHPRTLRLTEQLAAAVSGRPFRIEAPALTLTKAQVIQAAPTAADSALAQTVSCDTGFSARVRDHAPCGICTSCLLRRQGLQAAGRTDLDAAASYRSSPLAHPVAFQAMMWQVTRLDACLAQPDPWLSLVSEFPEVLDTAPLAPADVVSLYRSYVREWKGLEGAFPIGGQLRRQGRAAL